MSSSEPEALALRAALPAPEVTDGAAWLRAARAGAGTPRAWPALRRALLLETPGALPLAAELAPALPPPEARALLALLADVGPWGAALELRRRWASGAPAWAELLGELAPLAAAAGEPVAALDAEAWRREGAGALRLAVAGEFNAGKSTLVNALVGSAVSAVGVRPTTAAAHRVTWGEDPIARVVNALGERVVALARLPAVLAEAQPGPATSVTVWTPSDALRGLDLVDTPGSNALAGGPAAGGQPRDARAVAHDLGDDAHAVLWLLDATQPLKASEVGALEEVAALGLPLLVGLSRADRLPDDAARARVLAFVTGTLAERGVSPAAPVIALAFPRGAAPVGIDALLAVLRERLVPERAWLIRDAQRGRLRRRVERWRARLAAPSPPAPDQPPASLCLLAVEQGLAE